MSRKVKTANDNQTFGFCEQCGRFYQHPDYVRKFGKVFCNKHADEYEKNNPELKEIVRKGRY